MRLADTLVGSSAVLKVEGVGVGLVLSPHGSRTGRLRGEVILGTEIVEVVVLIDGLDVASETLERFLLAVLVDEEGGDGREFGMGLEAGEDEDILLVLLEITLIPKHQVIDLQLINGISMALDGERMEMCRRRADKVPKKSRLMWHIFM